MILEIILGILLIVASVFLIIAVLMQSTKEPGLSGTIAGGAETFFGKSKGKTIDKKLNTLTIIVSSAFIVVVILFYILQPGNAGKIKDNADLNGDGDAVVTTAAVTTEAVTTEAVTTEAITTQVPTV